MSNFYCFGTNFRISGLKNLEKISFNRKDLKVLYAKLKENGIEEVIILSTCNRLEMYWIGEIWQKEKLIKIITEFKKELPQLLNDFYFIQNYDAFKHLLFVALGFDSMLNVEEDIVTQLKNAYTLANSLIKLNKFLHIIFQKTIHYSRFLKNKYNLSQFRFSLAECIIRLSLKIFSTLFNKNILILGTGLISKTIINKIYNKAKSIHLYSCHEDRINRLITEFGRTDCRTGRNIYKVNQLDNLNNFDIIIGATSSTNYIIEKKHIVNSSKEKIALFDLGMPRNISPEISNLSNAFLFTLDDIYEFHNSLFNDKINEYELLKENIGEEINQMWNTITLETENIDWTRIKKLLKTEISNNLNKCINDNIKEFLINKLSHKILKNIKNNLIVVGPTLTF